MHLANVRYRREHIKEGSEFPAWKHMATLRHDPRNGWSQIMIDIWGGLHQGLFVASLSAEFKASGAEPPYIAGDIISCVKAKGAPMWVGMIYTEMDEGGTFKNYRGEICVPLQANDTARLLPIVEHHDD